MRVRGLPLVAAAVAAVSPALAGDLPKAPLAPSAVPCPSKGQGFVRLPGSESCMRISGRVVAGMDARVGHGAAAAPLVAGRLAIDNRADTDLGEVRTYVRIGNGRR